MNYSPCTCTSGAANILVHYLVRNSCCDNTIFSFNGGQEGILQRVKIRSKRKIKQDNNLCLRLPSIQFKNFKCTFENTNVYISNLFVSEYFHMDTPNLPPMNLIMSIESDCDNPVSYTHLTLPTIDRV